MKSVTVYIDTSSVDVYSSRRLPARLTIIQVAKLLNFQVYELVGLVRLGRLKCLGSPRQSSRKYFSRAYIERIAEDPDWLSHSTKAIAQAVREKNGQPARHFNRSAHAG
jgi:hypothetical protein